MRILLVDDEKQLVSAVEAVLKRNNFAVDCAYNGEDGLDMALSGIYDVIVLDIMMPKLDGISLLRQLRKSSISSPVIMLSAKGETEDKINGLDSGADDYLAKPFEIKELMARIRALTRRKAEFTGNSLSFGDISLDRNKYELQCKDHAIKLGKKEFQMLEILILNKGKTIDKETLIQKVWGYDSDAEYNNIEVYISFLRKKINAVGSSTEIISLRNIGYRLGEKND